MSAKTLLVFGARHLGKTLAQELSGAGWNVAGVALSADTVAALQEAVPDALGITADATRADEVDRVFGETEQRFGAVDLVVNAITARGGIGGRTLAESPAEATDPYVGQLVPAVFNVLRTGCRVLGARGSGTIVQVTGGSARRGMPGRGPWAAGAFASRALTQAAAQEMRETGVHVALLIVDATIESDKTRDRLSGPPEASTSEQDVVQAIRYLESQSPRAWTHELQITPCLDRWVP